MRNIVVCLDGTNNKYNATNTNVVKLYGLLDRTADDQLAYYQPGIGTMLPVGVWGTVRRWLAAQLDQNLWTSKTEPGLDSRQVWFPGVHCDVGGGYPEAESDLSKVTLKWMMGQAEAKGLKFSAMAKADAFPPTAASVSASDEAVATKHESLKHLWWIPELFPRRVKDPANAYQPHWVIPLGHSRVLLPGASIHSSVFKRQKKDPSYTPRNIPAPYIEVE